MPSTRPQGEPNQPAPADGPPADRAGPAPVNGDSFRESFGEDLRQVLDVNTWQPGHDLAREYGRIEREVREALAQEDDVQRRTRALVFRRLFDPAVAPPGGGVYRADLDAVRLVHRGLL